MKFKALIIFSLILFISDISDTAAIQNIETIGSAVVDVEITGKLIITKSGPSSRLEWVEERFSIPRSDNNLEIIDINSTWPFSTEFDEYGNKLVILRWENVDKETIPYKLVIRVKHDGFSAAITDIHAGNASRYLKYTNLTRWNPEIGSKSQELCGTSVNDLICVAKISRWINDNIRYDSTVSKRVEPAEWVFENKRGTCDEFSNLFIAMCRSIGIPARGVNGMSHDGQSWGNHGWAEAYLNDWISIDPTYDEIGFVDGTHIAFGRSLDTSGLKDDTTWKGIQVSVENTINRRITTIELDKSPKLINIRPNLSSGMVGRDSFVKLTAEIENLANSHIVGTCRLSIPKKLKLFGGTKRFFYVEPHAKTRVIWILQTPKYLKERYIYTYPIVIETYPHANASIELKADGGKEGQGYDAEKVEEYLNSLNATYLVINRTIVPITEDLYESGNKPENRLLNVSYDLGDLNATLSNLKERLQGAGKFFDPYTLLCTILVCAIFVLWRSMKKSGR